MKTNPLLKEIRRARDQLAEETGMDLRRLFALAKREEAAAQARGVVFVPAPFRPAAAVREENPPYAARGKEAVP